MVICDMQELRNKLKSAVAAVFLIPGLVLPVFADVSDPATVAGILERLKKSSPDSYEVIERELKLEWSKSGSAAMNLLLQRGNDALDAEDYPTAFEHFAALTDHAPDFAEGWNGRATALFHMGKFGQSLAAIEETLRLNPDQFNAMIGFGIIMTEMGNPQAAVSAFRKAASIHPHREDINTALERLEKEVEGVAL